jgi:aspartyl-tRNA(Asn)/glutamyl-tRNA(Gln) amidotransferase subunit C
VSGLTRGDVAHVAALARLALTDDELERYTVQLAAVLDHAEDLAAFDLDGIAPTAHPNASSSPLRDDEVVPCLPRDEVLAAAPAVEDDRFCVPRIIGEAP